MSLERFELKKNIIHPLLAISFINFILMIVVLVMSTTVFAVPSGVAINFPTFREDTSPSGQQVEIVITSENVLYIDGKVVTLNELRRFLARRDLRSHAIMVKADRHSSMGRLADILDLCKGISNATVHVSTIL
ncbi:MAG: biopolymer transporter ExbD [Candidatus Omnitrophica bacterium]|nr:biopolymer transporter ExbD [Candidatus Omnitrophota bacterium]